MGKAAVAFLSIFVVLLMVPYYSHAQNKKSQSLVIRVGDHKEFKKLIRTRTNFLVVCSSSSKATSKVMKVFDEVANEMKGKATLAYINCGDDKKLCKKIKVNPSTFVLRHYKDGEFNKEYDRKVSYTSMVNFLNDPTGEAPWEEDPTANNVVHVMSEDGWGKLLRKAKNPILAMFYAPWCGYCKKLKPEFAEAATLLKSNFVLAGLDVDRQEMIGLRMRYNITGFPTLYYFVNGEIKFKYGGENSKEGILKWLNNPQAPKEPVKEKDWADEGETEVHHLNDAGFKSFVLDNPSVLVMFYAPWCGHCKKMKPAYTDAAAALKEQNIQGKLAALDATKNPATAKEFGVKGYPTVKYFKDGEFQYDMNGRTEAEIIEFMKDPQAPPPPPPPEPAWEDTESEVVHLTGDTFKTIKKKKWSLIMFYAPWCGHCKKAKPEYTRAAANFADDSKVMFAAMDCTKPDNQKTCSQNDVTGYPTFKYFNYGKNPQKYMGGRLQNNFIAFMENPNNPAPEPNSKPATKSYDEQWKEFKGYNSVEFLTSENFEFTVANTSPTLVFFYAPWCKHCSTVKPDYAKAAATVEKEGTGQLAVVDVTMQQEWSDTFGLTGLPTFKLYKKDGTAEDYQREGGRSYQDFVDYMRRKSAESKKDEL